MRWPAESCRPGGTGMAEAKLLDPAEQIPQLAEDSFDPQLRDRLVSFFATALHRDPARGMPH